MEKKLSTDLKNITEAFEVTQPLRLMFQDEARFGRISDPRYCWAPYPLRPMVKAMLTHQYTYAYGAVSPIDGRFDSLVLPHVNTDCMQIFLNEIAARYPHENIIIGLWTNWRSDRTRKSKKLLTAETDSRRIFVG